MPTIRRKLMAIGRLLLVCLSVLAVSAMTPLFTKDQTLLLVLVPLAAAALLMWPRNRRPECYKDLRYYGYAFRVMSRGQRTIAIGPGGHAVCVTCKPEDQYDPRRGAKLAMARALHVFLQEHIRVLEQSLAHTRKRLAHVDLSYVELVNNVKPANPAKEQAE